MCVILHIDTSDKQLYLSIAQNGVLIDKKIIYESNNHVALIQSAMNDLLFINNIDQKKLNGVAVLNGPGSYTGLRVGLSFAKALCFALEIPLLLSNKLELMAYQLQHTLPVIPIIKAMDGEYFFAKYSYDKILIPPQLIKSADFLATFQADFLALLLDESVKIELSINNYEIVNFDHIYAAFIAHSYSQMIDSQHFALETAVPFYYKNTYIAVKM